MRLDPGALAPAAARDAARTALWTFPSMLASAFVVAWAAEAAQFFVSQGLALALLAWIQVLPEFAVEAVIAWHRDVPLMTANFTGALRLLTGLGWPLIWLVHAAAHRGPERWAAIALDDEHAVEVAGLVPPLLYFGWIVWKGTLGLGDAAVLLGCYALYLATVNRIPPREHETAGDVGVVPRAVLSLRPGGSALAIGALFALGGALLYVSAHPFLASMLGIAAVAGVPAFVFVQWVAPFLSEFPEFTTTTYWARRGKPGMALMNMASSNINQWTVLAAMIPIVYSLSLGRPAAVPIGPHRLEVLLTLLQGALGTALLANLRFEAYEALGLLLLWLVQFLAPETRGWACAGYAAWLAAELAGAAWRREPPRAFVVLPRLWRRRGG